MDPKLCLLAVLFITTVVLHLASAEFFYSHVLPKAENIDDLGLKCAPGRTVIKISEKAEVPVDMPSSGSEEEEILRSHMSSGVKEEYCKICVCSVDGKNVYCSERPPMLTNECTRVSKLMKDLSENPFDHTRTLSYRIRRDYLWHKDEIPYKPTAKCLRGHSYYSNSVTAHDTDIDVDSDVESLLDYNNKTICFYCVCSVAGNHAGCISRQEWFCEYYRNIRNESAPRDRYRQLFQQDRPVYFRSLSWRLRRTMDAGMYDFMETGGDTLCCHHPDGHRRNLHSNVRSKVRGLRRKVPKENLMNGHPLVGNAEEQSDASKCIPYVSEYSDCTDENKCSGCNKCRCVGENKWSCEMVTECSDEDLETMDEENLDNALYTIQSDLQNSQRAESATSRTPYVPSPEAANEANDLLLDFAIQRNTFDEKIQTLLRGKRSAGDPHNRTEAVQFHHTLDELNEDTLKNGNLSGTLQANKVKPLPTPLKVSRRTSHLKTDALPQNDLQIEHNQAKAYDDQLTDNKIDSIVHNSDKHDEIDDHKINTVIGNGTQKQKDKELSKLIVNELKSGVEVIGDKNAPIMSNITFTPANDTLTAMAFIAGNLLNKLWNMEKDSGEDSRETDVLKHEKIADLLDLFKEPLNLRQETFLKNALQQLSKAVDKDKSLDSVSLCDKLSATDITVKSEKENITKANCNKEDSLKNSDTSRKTDKMEKELYSMDGATISKVNNVLSLIKNFQNVQNKITTLKETTSKSHEEFKEKSSESTKMHKSDLTSDETESFNVFGNILEKVTKLLMPPKKSKKMVKVIRNQSVFKSNEDIVKMLKNMYNIDIDNATLTPKDKLVFDYLNNMRTNPKHLFDNPKEENTKTVANIEGDILLNLSEFFKIKSFVDLIKLIEPDSKTGHYEVEETTKQPKPRSRTQPIVEITTAETTTTTQHSDLLLQTKEKLKLHLRTILDDLIELQHMKGQPTNNISIIDALPCIFKLLNNETPNKKPINNKASTQVAKVNAIFDSLKKEIQAAQNRRSNTVAGERPKSAVVWERVIKNFGAKNKHKTRRSMEQPKSFEEIQKQIDQIKGNSKSYKNAALTNGVPTSERQIVLKTLQEDIKQYINTLSAIKNSLDNLKDLSPDNQNDWSEFVDNAAFDVNLDKQISESINISNNPDKRILRVQTKTNKMSKPAIYIAKKSMKMVDLPKTNAGNNMKLSRNAIINQLIKNRMQLYVKIKESNGVDLSADMNYDIAKKILEYLDIGNYNLARELYKLLIAPQQKAVDPTVNRIAVPTSSKKPGVLFKEPMMQFPEPQNQPQWLSQETWLKQLINLKNMRA